MSKRYYIAAGVFSGKRGLNVGIANSNGVILSKLPEVVAPHDIEMYMPVVSCNPLELFSWYNFAYHVYQVFPGKDVAKLAIVNERILQPDFRVGIVQAPKQVEMSELQFHYVQRKLTLHQDACEDQEDCATCPNCLWKSRLEILESMRK